MFLVGSLENPGLQVHTFGAVHFPLVQAGVQTGKQFLLFFGSLVNPGLQVHTLGAVHFPLVQAGVQTGKQFLLFFGSLVNPGLQVHTLGAVHFPLVQAGVQDGTHLLAASTYPTLQAHLPGVAQNPFGHPAGQCGRQVPDLFLTYPAQHSVCVLHFITVCNNSLQH